MSCLLWSAEAFSAAFTKARRYVRRELRNENRGSFGLLKNTEQRLKEDCNSVELCCDTQRAGKGNHVSRAC